MAVMDEFREERKALKNADPKTKWQYFLDYYKWYVIGGIAVIAIAISMIHSALTAKDCAFSGYFLNTYADIDKSIEFTNQFAEVAGINLDEYDILLDTSLQLTPGVMDENSMATQQKVVVTIAAQETDFLAADETAFLQYANLETFYDLREIYTEDELKKFKDYIYYIDMDVIREKEEIIDSGEYDDYVDPVYDHFAPDEMGDPVPIALCIQDCPKMADVFYFRSDVVPFGFVANTQKLDTTKLFIEYLFEDLVDIG